MINFGILGAGYIANCFAADFYRVKGAAIAAVAARVGSNTAYVSAAINSQRECSFSQFLTAYRIAYAQELMRKDEDVKISTVGTLSGFSTDSTFFRAFRSVTGMSPKEWLSANQNDQRL